MSTKKVSKSIRKDYVNPEELYYEILRCQKLGTISNKCLEYFDKMITKILNMNTYPYVEDKEDCHSNALLYCCKSVFAFDPTKSSNAFSFFTQVIKNATTMAWNTLYPKKYKNTIGFVGSSEKGTGLYSL
jgi:hypothetical protein